MAGPHLGRAPFQPRRPRINVGRFVDPAYAPPGVSDHASLVPEWPEYANDRYGDCVWAAIGHAVQSLTYYGGTAYTMLSERELLTAYSAVTGFDPFVHGPENPTDQGTVVADALAYWRKVGIAGDQIRAYAYVAKQFGAYAAGIDLFGFLNVGIRLPRYAFNRFESGADHWDLPTPSENTHDDGGHSIHVAGYDSNARFFLAVTWGRLIRVSWDFLHRYADEAWVVITDDWLDDWGHTPRGLDLHALGAEFERLTGDPSPVAGRRARPRQADERLWSSVRSWVGQDHRGDPADVAESLRTWAATYDLPGSGG